ncbi:hypothetical protein GN956_G14871 [Arapaima gigas]
MSHPMMHCVSLSQDACSPLASLSAMKRALDVSLGAWTEEPELAGHEDQLDTAVGLSWSSCGQKWKKETQEGSCCCTIVKSIELELSLHPALKVGEKFKHFNLL